jgi:hypothetical protein
MVDTLCSGYRLRDNRLDQEIKNVPADGRHDDVHWVAMDKAGMQAQCPPWSSR